VSGDGHDNLSRLGFLYGAFETCGWVSGSGFGLSQITASKLLLHTCI